jgi:hypothetical protein
LPICAYGNEAQERIRFLGRPTGRKGENPREEKAQEGRALPFVFNIRWKRQMLTGNKTLKWSK